MTGVFKPLIFKLRHVTLIIFKISLFYSFLAFPVLERLHFFCGMKTMFLLVTTSRFMRSISFGSQKKRQHLPISATPARLFLGTPNHV